MKRPIDHQEKRKHRRHFIELPLEYCVTENPCRGGIAGNVSERGLLVSCTRDMAVGDRLGITVFFPNEFEFDGFSVQARIAWKDVLLEKNWQWYRYGLEFVEVSDEAQQKLQTILKA